MLTISRDEVFGNLRNPVEKIIVHGKGCTGWRWGRKRWLKRWMGYFMWQWGVWWRFGPGSLWILQIDRNNKYYDLLQWFFFDKYKILFTPFHCSFCPYRHWRYLHSWACSALCQQVEHVVESIFPGLTLVELCNVHPEWFLCCRGNIHPEGVTHPAKLLADVVSALSWRTQAQTCSEWAEYLLRSVALILNMTDYIGSRWIFRTRFIYLTPGVPLCIILDYK